MQVTRKAVILRYLIVSFTISALFGCGFVDDAGEGDNSPPAVTGADIQANEGETVILTSSVGDDFNNIKKYEWTQVDNGAPEVEIKGADQPQASFDAPVVKVPESPLIFEFLLTVTDNFDAQGEGTVTVAVNAVNELPVAQDDDGETDEGFAVTVNVVENDSDSDGTLDPTTVEISSQSYGTAVANEDGTVVFTHDGSEPNTNDFNGVPNTAGFTYTVRDDETSASVPANVAIAVNPVNDAPIAVDDEISFPEDCNKAICASNEVVIEILNNDTDPDSAIVTEEVTIKTSPKKANIQINQGVITYTPGLNLNGPDSFTYTIKDVEGLESNVATVNVTIIPINDPPIAEDDSFSVDEKTENNRLNLLRNDSDVEGGLVVESLIILAGPNNGTISGPSNGIVRYTPNDKFRDDTDTLTYQVADNEGLTDTATVTIRVEAVNEPPTIRIDGDEATIDEDTTSPPFSFTVEDEETSASDLRVTASSSNESLIPDENIDINGTGERRAFTVTPRRDRNGSATIKLTVRDTGDGSDGPETDSDTFTVRVRAVNDPPEANDDTASTDENEAVTIDVLDNDDDAEDGEPDSVTDVSNPPNGSADPLSNGSIRYTPDPGFNGEDSFTYRAVDSEGVKSKNSATVRITVRSVNERPIARDDNASFPVGQPVTIAVLANDEDPDGSLNPGTVTVTSGPSNGTASVNGAGTITYTPNGPLVSQDSFQYTVDDNEGETSNEATVTVRVPIGGGAEDGFGLLASSAGDMGCWSTPQDKPFIGTLDDGSASKLATYRILVNGSKGSVSLLDPTTGRFEYVPNQLSGRGVDRFAYEVNDPDAGATVRTAQIIITPKILPLGGSVTAGLVDGAEGLPTRSERVGYRSALYDELRARGYQIDLVGTQSDGAAVAGFDSGHEGHPGWTAAELAYGRVSNGGDGIYAWLEANPADVILLHAGTHGLNTSPAQIAEILDEIQRWERSARGNPVTVLVARVIDQNPLNPDVQAFNDNVAAMVRERVENPANPAYPDKLLMVDQQAALRYPDDLFDAEHPTEAGYEKMASQWRDALISNNVLPKCP